MVALVGCGGAQPGAAAPTAGEAGATERAEDGSGAEEGNPGTPAEPGKARGEAGSGAAAAADPYADMPHPAPVDTGRPQLEAGDVRDTVEGYRPHLRKLCWEPRVNAIAGGPATSRVAVEVEVSPDGSVKGSRVVGGKGYEGLADCVQGHVAHWQFPRAKQTSSLMFPIVFERGEATYVQVK